MDRDKIIQICEDLVLDSAANLFGTSKDCLGRFADYEGCANLVYSYESGNEPRVLRITYRPDRSVEYIQAELHFINYLAENFVRVAKPVPSIRGHLVEVIDAARVPFKVVSFQRGRGMRVPDNGYRYREGVPIEEYYQNWGRVLGQMHRLARTYKPFSDTIRRPEWDTWEYYAGFPYGEQLPVIQTKFDQLISELQALPRDVDGYGLIHNDFNDGNFTVDYDNGDITVFDFDDSCYFWFMYDLACAWEGGIGRVMFRPLKERRDFMDHYMEQVMDGYSQENSITEQWLERLPLFLRLIQLQELTHYARYLDEPDETLQSELRYKIRCIEEDIPYLGFYDRIYNPEHPFSIQKYPFNKNQ